MREYIWSLLDAWPDERVFTALAHCALGLGLRRATKSGKCGRMHQAELDIAYRKMRIGRVSLRRRLMFNLQQRMKGALR